MISDMKMLATFVEVAQRCSFADTARALGVPASTVTTRVKNLEAELGVRLLARSTRKVSLTAEGREFVDSCRQALAHLEAGIESISKVQMEQGRVRVSIPTAFPKAKFASLLARFRQDFPSIYIEVFVEDRLADFVEEKVDLALRGGAPGGDDLYARHLADTPVIFVVPAVPAVRTDESELVLLAPLESATRQTKQGGLSTQSLELALALVIADQACAYLPLTICEEALSAKLIKQQAGPLGPRSPLTLFLVYQDKKYQPKRVRLLKEFLIEALSEIQE